MAHAAVRELLMVHVVTSGQLHSGLHLVGGLPLQVENLIAWTNEFLRLAMAIEAPFHVKRIGLAHQGHLVHGSVTRGAADAFVDVDAVVKKNEIRKVVNTRPS